jgi:HPt (histidine-containing phosphotransfer) domain-containing protein
VSQLLDKTVISELREIMGDEYGFLIQTFIDDAKSKLASLQKSIVEEDWEQTFRTAHSLKGSCRNVGALQLATCLEKLEQNARHLRLEEIPILFEVAESLFQQTSRQLNP